MAKWTQSLMATFPTPAPPGSNKKLVLGLGASPWVLWYDENLLNISAPATGPMAEVSVITFSPDGNLCVIATATALYRYDTSGGTPTYMGAFPSPPAWGHIEDLTFSPDGSRLVVTDSQLSPYCWVYNTSTWASTTAPSSAAGSTVTSWVGTKLAMALGGPIEIRLRDTPAMTASASQPGTQPSVGAWANVAISPDGVYLAAHASADPAGLRVWQMSSLSAPLSNPGTMPFANSASKGKSIAWNPSSTKFILSELYGSSIYNVSGTSITLDTQLNYNALGALAGVWRKDGAKLFLASQGGAPRFSVYTVSGWSKDANPATQPASDPRAIGSNI